MASRLTREEFEDRGIRKFEWLVSKGAISAVIAELKASGRSAVLLELGFHQR